ncbi:Neuroglian [Carabus blaptoides fortunei]
MNLVVRENEQLNNSVIFKDNSVFRNLVIALEIQDGWQRIVALLAGILDPNEWHSECQSPGEKILLWMSNKQSTVGNLLYILRECKLYDALAVLITEKSVIEKQLSVNVQDNRLLVKRGKRFSLEFIVSGIPRPTYTWYKDNHILAEHISSDIVYERYMPDLEGVYYAIATQILADGSVLEQLTSDSVTVETLPESCVIIKKPPKEWHVCTGQSVLFEIIAVGYPAPKYEWTYKNKVIKNTGNSLQMTKVSQKMAGEYRCRVYNCANELIIKTKLNILETDLLPVWPKPVVEKVALLVGNQCYQNIRPLTTPVSDVTVLDAILKSKGFLVISGLNLNLENFRLALQKFCEILVEGAFGLLYFAGHGFELGEKYLLPVDAPDEENYGFRDSISEYQILRDVLQTKPKLFVLLLDMCLVWPDREKNPGIYKEKKQNYQYIPERNLIQGYSTTSGLSAYELENGRNSLYVTALLKYIDTKLPMLKVLAKVNQELENNYKRLTIDEQQMPYVSFNVANDIYLDCKKIGDPHSQFVYNQMS